MGELTELVAEIAQFDWHRARARKLVLREASARERAVRGPHKGCGRALATAAYQLKRAEGEAVLSAAQSNLVQLDAAMPVAIGEVETIVQRLGRGGPPAWGASPALYARLRSLAAAHREL